MPQPLRAAAFDSPRLATHGILAWRSPTETLLLGDGPAAFIELAQRLASMTDGCMVDQSGGFCAIRVQGRKGGELLQRLGAETAIPGLGEARVGRLAEVTVLTAAVRSGELLLLIERVYAEHLQEWLRATVKDMGHCNDPSHLPDKRIS